MPFLPSSECPHPALLLTPTLCCLTAKPFFLQLSSNFHARSPFHVVFLTWFWFLVSALNPWRLFSFLLGYSILPAKQTPFLHSSSYLGFDLGFESTLLCMESLFTLLRFQLLVPAVLYINAPHTLLERQYLALGCPFALDALLHGHPCYHVQASTPHTRPLLCGDGLAWTPVRDHLSLWTLSLPCLVSNTLYWALLQWGWLPLSSCALAPCTGLPSHVNSLTLLMF